jgi:predicted lipoprotein with Yx(FWY)xxD motif
MIRRTTLIAATMAVLTGAPLHAETMPDGVAVTTTDQGEQTLIDKRGMTLYVFDRDVAGVSYCYGMCEAAWLPFKASERDTPAGAFTIAVRRNGDRQWVYKGRPLYLFSWDKKPGDIAGDDFRDAWHIAKP